MVPIASGVLVTGQIEFMGTEYIKGATEFCQANDWIGKSND